jgi:hypothetical protein
MDLAVDPSVQVRTFYGKNLESLKTAMRERSKQEEDAASDAGSLGPRPDLMRHRNIFSPATAARSTHGSNPRETLSILSALDRNAHCSSLFLVLLSTLGSEPSISESRLVF